MHQLLAQFVLAIVLNDYVLTRPLPVWVRRSFLARGLACQILRSHVNKLRH